MVKFVGFDDTERNSLRGMMDRFRTDGFELSELVKIKKAALPGYDGKVVPRRIGNRDKLKMDMFLCNTNPFTVAHELAHVSDISVRRSDSMDNLTCGMAPHWHLAYKMFSEYYANRVACEYASEADTVAAFRSDLRGWLVAIAQKDWGNFLYYYSLLMGIMHGTGRFDVEPTMHFLPRNRFVPTRVVKGMVRFRHQAVGFWESY